jgi:transcriptional regulator with XRE-family HTH domain
LLRQWRQRRGASQLVLATESDVSTRHLSYLETGRSTPSREMVVRLCEALDIPLRERNALLEAAGFAAVYAETDLAAPEMGAVNRIVDFLLERHAPYPAILMDRCWNILRLNSATGAVLGVFGGNTEPFRTQPLNLLRITLHPDGLQRYLVNFEEVAYELLAGLARATARSGDAPELAALELELRSLPGVEGCVPAVDPARAPVVALPLHVKKDDIELRFFSAITVMASAQDVTVEELRIESLMPADDATDAWVRAKAPRDESA